MDDEPVTVQGTDPDTGDAVEVEMTGYDLMSKVFEALYDSTMIPELPKMIFDAANGDPDSLAPLLGLDYKGYQDDEGDISDSEGMNFSVECTEEIPFNDEKKAVDLTENAPSQLKQNLIDDVQSAFNDCTTWDVPKAKAVENEPVKSDIPTLVLSGEYDPITPPAWGDAAAKYLPNSFSFTFLGLGHGATGSNSCVDGIIQAFLADPTKKPNSSCIAKMGEPKFVTK
jgi:pimeloyl-ACP methyl ester carboxylesterase